MATRMLNLNNLTSSIGASLSNPLRSKKKYHFDVTLTLQELKNCTFVSGVIFAKLQLKDGGSFNGSSHRNEVERHSVQWDDDFNFSCKMYSNPSTMVLEPCYCKISIRKETKGGKSCTKLGYVKINLAEFAGQGTKQRKYLLQSYNEDKHNPDNSLLIVKLYLRQTSGDIFKAPETSQVWEKGSEEDEGFQDDWLSIYSKGSHTPRASNGSTLSSSFSIATGGTWSSHGGSAGNLKSQGSCGEISNREGGGILGNSNDEGEEEEDRESGSEETVIEKTSSQITTTDTLRTGSSNNTGSWKSAETGLSGQTRLSNGEKRPGFKPHGLSKTSSPNLSPAHSYSNRTSSPTMNTRSQSANNITLSPSLQNTSNLSPSSPILEEPPNTDPLSLKKKAGGSYRQSDPFQTIQMWSGSDSQEQVRSKSDRDIYQSQSSGKKTSATGFLTPPSGPGNRLLKGGATVQTSHVTAVPGGISRHQRQASMGFYHLSPSPLTVGHHRRHNSFSTSINTDVPYSETTSLHSTRTRVSTLSTLEQSRVDNISLIDNLIAAQDLTPASDDDSANLKLYIDKHGGGVTIAGHNLDDKYRFKEIDVSSFSSEEPRAHKSKRHRSVQITHSPATTPSTGHSQQSSSSDNSTTNDSL